MADNQIAAARLNGIAPFFIVGDVVAAAEFYRDRFGFEIDLLIPVDDPFFAIVQRDSVRIFLKHVDDQVASLPNPVRHADARWDAFIHTDAPDTLAIEYSAQDVAFVESPGDTHDGLRGFSVRDLSGYVLFFGHPL